MLTICKDIYIKGDCCPICNSTNIETIKGYFFRNKYNSYSTFNKCNECGGTWHEHRDFGKPTITHTLKDKNGNEAEPYITEHEED